MSEGAQLFDTTQYHELMYTRSKPRLQHLAWHALNEFGMQNDDVIVACVQVDSAWREVADVLMPDHDWQPIRDQGEEPLANGLAGWGLCVLVASLVPEIAKEVLETPPEGKVKVLVLSDYKASVYEIEPKQDVSPLH